MDPQSTAFTPQSDIWKLSDAMRGLQATQQEHAERLGRLERRQDGDTRMKSVWGVSSPFPGILSGTPQQGPQRTPNEDFNGFDDDESSNNMVRSLHLDADDEPRRFVAASRANSVRFDESAKPAHWNHAPRSSMDFISRASSGLGGHPMFERTASHKSDGRQSSAGHSASGRANSLGLDASQTLGQSSTDLLGLVPGLMILGTVPSIIRCWLNMNFKHDALLYAAVCSGSYRSFIDLVLIERLDLSRQIRHDVSGNSKIRLPVYLPEATSHPISSRPSSPAPQLPSVTVDFTVIDSRLERSSSFSKGIHVFLGSDMLQQHSGDVLFSSNIVSLFDDERNRLSIPLVRPENEEMFKRLRISGNGPDVSKASSTTTTPAIPPQDDMVTTNGTTSRPERLAVEQDLPLGETVVQETVSAAKSDEPALVGDANTSPIDFDAKPNETQRQDRKPSLTNISTTRPERDVAEEGPTSSPYTRNSSSPAVWSSWRRDGPTSTANDWSSTSRSTSSNYQRASRDVGIKVLKPSSSRQTTRVAASTSQSPAVPQSRFFDDGKRRVQGFSGGEELQQVTQSTPDENGKALAKDGASSTAVSKTKSANPIGGASAFGWLTSASK